MKLIHGIANCLFALLSRATQATPKSKSACPDFIYRYDICAIYIFGVLSIEHTRRQRVLLMFFLLLLIALSVNKFGTLPNCRQIVAKNNRTNIPMLLLLLCVCVWQKYRLQLHSIVQTIVRYFVAAVGGPKASVINLPNVKTIKAQKIS